MLKIQSKTSKAVSRGNNNIQQPSRSGLLQNFRKDEGGTIVVFSLYIIILMVIVGSLGIFLMRTEYRRTTVQYTLDRAILAAASLDQELDPQVVVDDYFAKAGLSGVAAETHVEVSDNSRRVTVDTSVTTDPHMIGMFMDVASITTPIGATAVDGVEKVEISLVLDVSGSMGREERLVKLKVAAKEFVNTLLEDQPEPDTYSITIVPYSTQVNAGPNILSNYSVSNEHNYSHCVNFNSDKFNSTSLSTSDPLQRTGHFVPWTSSYRVEDTSSWNDIWKQRVCVPNADRHILPFSGDIPALEAYIDAFVAAGWTSTEIGIKWGTTLLDPSARSVVSNLIDNGHVNAKFSGRPSNYGEQGVLKVMVVMTDGANTNQYFLDPDVASNLSPVWREEVSPGVNRYWVYKQNRSDSKKYYRLSYNSSLNLFESSVWQAAPSGSATQMTYVELWKHASMKFISRRLFIPASLSVSSWNSWGWSGFFTRMTGGAKDVRMANICAAAKSKNVLLYTIGFEVTDSNAAKLQECATTYSHFFRVEGVEISEAFAAIAAQLHSLRLIR